MGLVVLDPGPQPLDAGEILPCSNPRAKGCEHDTSFPSFLDEERPQRDVQRMKFGQRIAALAALHPRGWLTPELRRRRWAADTNVDDVEYEVSNDDDDHHHDDHDHGDGDADDHGD